MDAMFMWRCAILVKSDVFVLIIHENKSFDYIYFYFCYLQSLHFQFVYFRQLRWYHNEKNDISSQMLVSAKFWPSTNANVTVPGPNMGFPRGFFSSGSVMTHTKAWGLLVSGHNIQD
jgi:hypothetical protein